MNLKVIKTFCDLVDTGSFSEAAKLNSVSQSAVSQQVAALEGELSTQLLCRGGRSALATEAGQVFYQRGGEILHRYDRMLTEMRTADAADRGLLRVGTIYSAGFYLLDAYIREFHRVRPDVSLQVEYSKWDRINAAVVRGEMDLGVVALPRKHADLEILPLADEQLLAVCSPRHRLASKKLVDPKDLADCDFIAFEPDVPTRKHIDTLLRRCRVRVHVAMEFDNVETLKRAIEINAGISILPAGTVRDEVADGYLHAAKFRRPERWVRRLGVLRRRGKAPRAAEKQFLDILQADAPAP